MRLPRQILEAMIAHARFTYPQESCGLLAADSDGRLRMAYCLTNVEASATNYTVDPTEHFRAIHHSERNGWELVGVFHSHPHSGARPSPTDVSLALEPDWIYIIVGLGGADLPETRAFWIRQGRIVEEPLSIED